MDQKLLEDDISVIFDRFSSIKCVFITKSLIDTQLLADATLAVVWDYLVGINRFSIDTKHLTSMKMLTHLAYVSDLTILGKLESVGNNDGDDVVILLSDWSTKN